MSGYGKIRAVKVKAARRKLARKKARWGGKVKIRCQGHGGGTPAAKRRRYMNASRMS